MSPRLCLLYDPLCGWCYGAGPAIEALAGAFGDRFELRPTGLFFGAGARPLDDAFAAYAWSADQRIQGMTGQIFTTAYRDRVLTLRHRKLDAGPALSWIESARRVDPKTDVPVLVAFQRARYVDGRDTTDPEVLGEVARTVVPDVATPDAGVAETVNARVREGRALLAAVGARGVPTLVVETEAGRRVVAGQALYGGRAAVLSAVEAAGATP